MKNYVLPAICLMAITVVSCQKQDVLADVNGTEAVVAGSAGNQILVSAWETGGSWKQADSVSTSLYQKTVTPSTMEQNSLVRVFLSNSNGDAIALPATVKGFEYYYVAGSSRLQLYARPLETSASAAPEEFQIKYVFIGADALKAADKQNISLENLMNFSLSELTSLTFEEPVATSNE